VRIQLETRFEYSSYASSAPMYYNFTLTPETLDYELTLANITIHDQYFNGTIASEERPAIIQQEDDGRKLTVYTRIGSIKPLRYVVITSLIT
jgi:hypothetical protein